MRDDWASVQAAGLTVFGVSFDSVKDNKKFADKESFPFLLLSDTTKAMGKAYGAKGMMPFPRRISYVIDEEGCLAGVLPLKKSRIAAWCRPDRRRSAMPSPTAPPKAPK